MPVAPSPSQLRPALQALRKFVRREPQEHCDFCSLALAGEHQHVLELASGGVRCCCDACAILFDRGAGQPFRRIPRDARQLRGFQMSDLQWEALDIPIHLAFFVDSSIAGRVVARYPSPGGAIEALPPTSTWQELAGANAELEKLQPDVEALLINRLGERHRYFILPIDQCYRLTGLIRLHWRGLSGGTEVWHEVERFFRELGGDQTVKGVGNA